MGTFREKIRVFAKRNYEKPHLQNMAIACGVNYQQLSKYDDDDLPSGYNLKKLRAIGVSIDWLLSDSLDMPTDLDFAAGSRISAGDFDEARTLIAIRDRIDAYLLRKEGA